MTNPIIVIIVVGLCLVALMWIDEIWSTKK